MVEKTLEDESLRIWDLTAADPVGPKYSSGLSVIEAEQAAKTFSPGDRSGRRTDPVIWGWKRDHVAQPLVVSLLLMVLDVVVECASE